ncbi:hypothetical protein MGY74_000006 [Enterococcus faecalis]|nr:hypothetical protein [Enterococcus faecalis]
MNVKLLYDLEILQNIQEFVAIDLDFVKIPHLLIVGGTNSGKTTFLRMLIGKLALANKKIIVCDYKSDPSFFEFDGLANYYRADDSKEGFQKVYDEFINRQQNFLINEGELYFIFDEYAFFINRLSKKEADEVKKQLAEMLMAGRTFGIHIVVALQRGDASYFPSGARDNFGMRLGLGALKEESKKMLFEDEKDNVDAQSAGKGYLLIDGQRLRKIICPPIKKEKYLLEVSKRALSDYAE